LFGNEWLPALIATRTTAACYGAAQGTVHTAAVGGKVFSGLDLGKLGLPVDHVACAADDVNEAVRRLTDCISELWTPIDV
jgi:hypothetical protein